jgi:hypothetical protein
MNYPYDSFRLHDERARKNLMQVFQTQNKVPVDGLPLRECRSVPGVWRSAKDARTRSADVSNEEKEAAWTGKDMSGFTIVLLLLLLGMLAAAQTDRPEFWLLVGPAPLAVGFTLITFFRQGFGRPICSKEKRRIWITLMLRKMRRYG